MSDGPAVVVSNEAGTNVAEVKAASTAAVAGDKALVVAVSPNNTVAVAAASLPLPSGAATAANQTTLGNQTTKINDGTNTATVTGANALKVDGSAVTQPVSDAGGSLTVDGTVAVSNFPAVQPVSDNGGSLTVDTPQLPASLVGGRLDVVVGASLPAGGNNIGDVDVASIAGTPDSGNSSTATLTANSTFTGTAFDALNYAGAVVIVKSDQASAANGAKLQWSPDGTNWDFELAFSIDAAEGVAGEVTHRGRFFRVVFTNGGINQTFFRLQTLHRAVVSGINQRPLEAVIDKDNFGQIVRSVLSAKNNSGNYINIDATNGGNLKVAVEEFNASLPAGNNNIGDVDVVSVPAPLSTTGGGTEATALRVTIANDSTGVVSVDDNGGSLTIDGTVTANVGTTGGLALDATLSAQSLVDNAAFTDGSSRVVPSGFVYDETSGPALVENDIAAARVDDKRAQVHVIEDAATRGQRMVVTAAGAAKVDGSAVTQPISAVSLPLPTGAATEATLATRLADSTFTGRINTLGQKTMANSTPVVLASDQTVIPVSDNAGSLTVDTPQLPAALVGGRLDANVGAWLGSTAPTVGQKTLSASIPVALASDQDNATATNQTTQITSLQLLDDLPHGMNAAFNKGVAIGGQLDDTSTTVATEDNIAPVRITAQRGLHVNLRNSSGETVGTVSRPIASEPTGGRTTVHNAATVTASGSQFLTWQGWSEWYLIINLKDAPTGTTPTIQYKIEEVEPLDQTTVVGQTITGVVHTAAGVEVLEIVDTVTDSFRISWTVTGASASWTNVNVTWMGHAGGNAVEGQAEEGQPLTDAPLPVAGVDGSNLVRTMKMDDQGRLVVVSASAAATTAGFALGTMVTTAVTDVPIRSTTYTEQASDAQRSLASANAADTSAGTGARQVKITYYTVAGSGPLEETVTLNGTTSVATAASNIGLIEKMEVVSVGSGGSNAGILTLFVNNAGGGGTIGTIAANANRTFWAHHYTPTGKTTFVSGIAGNNNHSSNVTVLTIRTKPIGGTAPEIVTSDYVSVGGPSGQESRLYSTPLEVVGPARLVLYGAPAGTPSITTRASFDFYDQDSA